MNAKTTLVSLSALTLALSLGCGSSSTTNPPKTYAEQRDNELESERTEFIADHRERLKEIDNEIGLLETKLKHESKFVDNEQRAEWSQDLFELKQERQQLRAELDRARTANKAEWEEMRGNFGMAFDSLEAGVIKLRDEVAARFEASDDGDRDDVDDDDQKVQRTTYGGFCPVDVESVKTEVKKQGNAVVVTVTTTDANQVAALRERAKKLVANGEYMPAVARTKDDDEAAQKKGMAVTARFDNVPGGVRVMFVPKDKAQLDALEEQIDDDLEALGTGRCVAEPKSS
jgi:hypothetical protein